MKKNTRTARINTRKDAAPAAAFNWSDIDWERVTLEKAKLIYSEAVSVKREILESLNSMNNKAFQMLAVIFSILTISGSLTITKWNTLTTEIKIPGLVFTIFLAAACIAFLMVVWPRGIHSSTSAPNAYFSHQYYKKSYLNILKGNIIGATDDIGVNRAVERLRSKRLKAAFIILGLSVPCSLISFLLGLLVSQLAGPLN